MFLDFPRVWVMDVPYLPTPLHTFAAGRVSDPGGTGVCLSSSWPASVEGGSRSLS